MSFIFADDLIQGIFIKRIQSAMTRISGKYLLKNTENVLLSVIFEMKGLIKKSTTSWTIK
jgi:hypothetical protein